MDVGIDVAGKDEASLGIDRASSLGDLHFLRRTDGGDFVPIDHDGRIVEDGGGRWIDDGGVDEGQPLRFRGR